MKGVLQAIANPPIDPICEEDERPAVRDLIIQYRKEIDEIVITLASNENTQHLYDKSKHDDLWFLRFVLSHKGHIQQALQAAEHTLRFRAEHQLDGKDIRKFPPGPLAQDESFLKYFDCIKDEAFNFDIPHPQRGVVVFLSSAGFDFAKLRQLTFEERLRAFAYINEWTHQWLDYITRTTGRLTRSARLVDVQGVGITQVDYETLRLEAKAIATMQDFYPQLLESFYICNPPIWARIPWKVLRPLLPSRVVHKIDFLSPGKSKHERKRLRAFLQEEHLPKVYGGCRGHHENQHFLLTGE